MRVLTIVLICGLAVLSLAEVATGRPLAPWRLRERDPLLVRGRAASMGLVAAALAVNLWLGTLWLASLLLAAAVVVLLTSAVLRARQGQRPGGPSG